MDTPPEPRMPAESHPHDRTFLAWPARRSVWGRYLPGARADIAGLARAIAEYEPVTLLATPSQAAAAGRACGSTVDVVPVPVDDLWIRDTGPTFVHVPGGVAGVDLNFNGWGGKARHRRDGHVAGRLLARYDLPRIPAPLVAEGGAIEVDGAGTLLATESSLVNDNRNPGWSRDRVEAALRHALGVRTVLWLAGAKGADITDYHVDALARFAAPGVVVLGRPHPDADPLEWRVFRQAREVLTTHTDARGRIPEIVELPAPDPAELGERGPDFLAGYVNYYVANGAVVLPRFGDRAADDHAAGVLAELYPGRHVVQLAIDTVAEGGGGIHCATQQQPAEVTR